MATVTELAEGPRRVEVDGKQLLVYEASDGIRAYRNVCPHQFGPVVEGLLDEESCRMICPWHGWEFDLETGENPYDPSVGAVPQATTTVEDGRVFVEL